MADNTFKVKNLVVKLTALGAQVHAPVKGRIAETMCELAAVVRSISCANITMRHDNKELRKKVKERETVLAQQKREIEQANAGESPSPSARIVGPATTTSASTGIVRDPRLRLIQQVAPQLDRNANLTPLGPGQAGISVKGDLPCTSDPPAASSSAMNAIMSAFQATTASSGTSAAADATADEAPPATDTAPVVPLQGQKRKCEEETTTSKVPKLEDGSTIFQQMLQTVRGTVAKSEEKQQTADDAAVSQSARDQAVDHQGASFEQENQRAAAPPASLSASESPTSALPTDHREVKADEGEEEEEL